MAPPFLEIHPPPHFCPKLKKTTFVTTKNNSNNYNNTAHRHNTVSEISSLPSFTWSYHRSRCEAHTHISILSRQRTKPQVVAKCFDIYLNSKYGQNDNIMKRLFFQSHCCLSRKTPCLSRILITLL